MKRLQKAIADSGYCSRRKAEEKIAQGKVKVNGEVITQMGYQVTDEDVIVVEGKKLDLVEKKVYYLLNKPREVISSVTDDKERKTVVDLIKCDLRIYPIGRLDYDTTGLILLTNDGELANRLMHPKNEIEKTYLAKVEGLITKEDILKLKRKLVIEDRPVVIKNLKVRKKDFTKETTLIEITIVEGRNHIVKKIFSAIGHEVIKLTRTSYAFLTLDNLKSGEYRMLSLKEVKKLYSLK
ncbi:MAG: rRNA pseudouridine synthase [Bacilli bacterium]|nr:rRNA pseudouridine synthase [Bacilli bacterium]